MLRGISFVTAVLLGVPSAALPCTGGHCHDADSKASAVPKSTGCCSVTKENIADVFDSHVDDSRHSQSPSRSPDGRCNCPPGCPAPCGSGGHMPLTFGAASDAGIVLMPIARQIETSQTTRATPASNQIFRPPRS